MKHKRETELPCHAQCAWMTAVRLGWKIQTQLVLVPQSGLKINSLFNSRCTQYFLQIPFKYCNNHKYTQLWLEKLPEVVFNLIILFQAICKCWRFCNSPWTVKLSDCTAAGIKQPVIPETKLYSEPPKHKKYTQKKSWKVLKSECSGVFNIGY